MNKAVKKVVKKKAGTKRRIFTGASMTPNRFPKPEPNEYGGLDDVFTITLHRLGNADLNLLFNADALQELIDVAVRQLDEARIRANYDNEDLQNELDEVQADLNQANKELDTLDARYQKAVEELAALKKKAKAKK